MFQECSNNAWNGFCVLMFTWLCLSEDTSGVIKITFMFTTCVAPKPMRVFAGFYVEDGTDSSFDFQM